MRHIVRQNVIPVGTFYTFTLMRVCRPKKGLEMCLKNTVGGQKGDLRRFFCLCQLLLCVFINATRESDMLPKKKLLAKTNKMYLNSQRAEVYA